VAKESYLAYLRQLEAGETAIGRRRDDSEPPLAKGHGTNNSQRSHSSKSFTMGTKRGASSPNLPSSSRDDELRFSNGLPLAKIYRDDAPSSCSQPNIGPNFGRSFLRNSPELMKPCTSSKSRSPPPSTSAKSANQAGSGAATSGLYEELLASASLAFDDWGNPVDEAQMLAKAMALSQQEFLDSFKKSPRNQF
jgi:hypothetical protein